jgi:NAD(P)-dependent dehydrogenase (short-subunit alcohol dehydrogenase family)
MWFPVWNRKSDLAGSCVVVTGASSGIGRATALAFARRGADVVVAARRTEPLDRLVAECEQAEGRAVAVTLDVTDEAAMDGLARTAMERFGRLDVWVNNAAVLLYHRFGEEPVADIRRLFDVNLTGYVLGARAALPWFREHGHGVLVNVGSVVSKVPAPYMTAYAMSKHGIRALGSCLRTELVDESDIHVCTVMPGSVDTPIFQHAANHTGRAAKALTPALAPERVAEAIVGCAVRPRRELTVGVGNRLMVAGHTLSKALTERASARVVHAEHFQDQPSAPTSGNLHEPMAEGDTVRGGWKAGTSPAARRVAVAAGVVLAGTALLTARRP